jgi:hypothetical protein
MTTYDRVIVFAICVVSFFLALVPNLIALDFLINNPNWIWA